MRRLFEGGVFSRKYGNKKTRDQIYDLVTEYVVSKCLYWGYGSMCLWMWGRGRMRVEELGYKNGPFVTW